MWNRLFRLNCFPTCLWSMQYVRQQVIDSAELNSKLFSLVIPRLDKCERCQQLLYQCFETLIVCPCLFIAIQLYWNFKLYCFYFFPKFALPNWGVRLIYGCGLYTDIYGSSPYDKQNSNNFDFDFDGALWLWSMLHTGSK